MKRLAAFLLVLCWLLVQPAFAAISFFGTASVPTDNGTQAGPGPTAISPPASMLAGDLVLVFHQYRGAAGTELSFDVSTTGGQSWHELSQSQGSSVALSVWACRFNGTWAANPSFSSDSTLAHTMWMVVFRPTSTSKLMDIDVAPVAGSFVAGTTPFTKTITGITTLNAGAVAIALWASADDNTWNTLTGGWSNPSGLTQVRNLAGTDQSMAIAYQVFPTAGATGNVSMNQATLGGDAGRTLIMSFYERDDPTGVPTVDVYADFETSTDGTTITGTIMGNSTHPASPGGTWAEQLGGGASNMTIELDAEKNFTSSRKVTANSVTYDDVGSTRGFQQDHSTQAALGKYWQFNLTTGSALVSIGHFFRTSVAYQSANFSGTFNQVVDGGFAGLTAFNMQYVRADRHTAFIENVLSETKMFAYLNNNTWYWITMQYDDTGNLGKVAVYDPATWTQVGFTGTQRLGTTPGNGATIIIGQNGGGLASQTALSYFDDLVIDYTTGQFPLLPGAAAAGGAETFGFRLRMPQ